MENRGDVCTGEDYKTLRRGKGRGAVILNLAQTPDRVDVGFLHNPNINKMPYLDIVI